MNVDLLEQAPPKLYSGVRGSVIGQLEGGNPSSARSRAARAAEELIKAATCGTFHPMAVEETKSEVRGGVERKPRKQRWQRRRQRRLGEKP